MKYCFWVLSALSVFVVGCFLSLYVCRTKMSASLYLNPLGKPQPPKVLDFIMLNLEKSTMISQNYHPNYIGGKDIQNQIYP